MKKIFAIFVFWMFCNSSVMAQACYSSSITSPTPFMGTGQETVTLLDGTKWKITDFTYLYLYSYYPNVTICPSAGKLTVGVNTFNVTAVNPVVTPTTSYTFQICNKSSVYVYAAVARLDSATAAFMSHGWYGIAAGGCGSISVTPIRYRYFYVYAEGAGGLVWQDPSALNRFCIDPIKAFDLTAGSCAVRGYTEKNFLEVDTGSTATTFTYNLTNAAPAAPTISGQFTATPKTGTAPLIVNFYGSGSSTQSTDQLSYLWTFGDGTTSTLQNPVHTFLTVGSFSTSLTISNSNGQSTNIPAQTITASAPPVVTSNSPPTGQVNISGYQIKGQTLTATNSLSDLDGMAVVNYQWQANFANISGATTAYYRLSDVDVGKSIRVLATFTDGKGKLESVFSGSFVVAKEGQEPVIFGSQLPVCILNRAFNNISPSNAVFVNQTLEATNDSQAFALNFGRSFDSLSDSALSSKVMRNMGLSPNPALEGALTAYFEANPGSRGLVVLQLGQLLSVLYRPSSADLDIYVPQASAWNDEVKQAYIYSSTVTNTAPSVN